MSIKHKTLKLDDGEDYNDFVQNKTVSKPK